MSNRQKAQADKAIRKIHAKNPRLARKLQRKTEEKFENARLTPVLAMSYASLMLVGTLIGLCIF